MDFHTCIPIPKQQHHLIDYQSKVLLIGSCFSENIGNKFTYAKFSSKQNPFGILFHPKAIEQLITNALNEKKYTSADIFFHNERWHSFEAHSSCSAVTQDQLLQHLNERIQQTKAWIEQASHIILTLGTAWVYREIASDTVVANCHKIPQKKFLKELLSVQEIEESLAASVALIKSVNPKATILFTVSPVRHLKDGYIENQQSKAHLIAAVHQTVAPRNQLHYFPSYEILMDELRDYRFYTSDMIHPNETAIQYIWERFIQTWISEKAQQTLSVVDKIQKGLAHRPFNKNSQAHQDFLQKLQENITTIQKQHPHISF